MHKCTNPFIRKSIGCSAKKKNNWNQAHSRSIPECTGPTGRMGDVWWVMGNGWWRLTKRGMMTLLSICQDKASNLLFLFLFLVAAVVIVDAAAKCKLKVQAQTIAKWLHWGRSGACKGVFIERVCASLPLCVLCSCPVIVSPYHTIPFHAVPCRAISPHLAAASSTQLLH